MLFAWEEPELKSLLLPIPCWILNPPPATFAFLFYFRVWSNPSIHLFFVCFFLSQQKNKSHTISRWWGWHKTCCSSSPSSDTLSVSIQYILHIQSFFARSVEFFFEWFHIFLRMENCSFVSFVVSCMITNAERKEADNACGCEYQLLLFIFFIHHYSSKMSPFFFIRVFSHSVHGVLVAPSFFAWEHESNAVTSTTDPLLTSLLTPWKPAVLVSGD